MAAVGASKLAALKALAGPLRLQRLLRQLLALVAEELSLMVVRHLMAVQRNQPLALRAMLPVAVVQAALPLAGPVGLALLAVSSLPTHKVAAINSIIVLFIG
jgi:hypothetical protein